MLEVSWTNIIVLYCVTRTKHLSILESFDCAYHFKLNLLWKSIVQALRINNITLYTLRLQPYLMRLSMWESDNLFLNRRAVPWSLSLPTIAFKCRQQMSMPVYHIMSFWIGICYMALYCFMSWSESFELMDETKWLNRVISTLWFKTLIVDGMLFKSWRCPSGSSVDWEIKSFKSISKTNRWRFSIRTVP